MNYAKLIEEVKEQPLHSIEFTKGSIKIKKQLGNNTGSQIEIEFNNSKRIHNIKFIEGGYNEPHTLKKGIADLFDLIINI